MSDNKDMDGKVLTKTLESLQTAIEKLTAESEVRKLHHKYGYYLDKCLYQEVVDLFSDYPGAYIQFFNGRYRGKESIRRLYCGRFAQRFEIVDLQPGSDIVRLRGRTFMSAGTHKSMPTEYPGGHRQWWEGGVYENEYIREAGVWKIFRLRYYPFWHGSFEEGWQHATEFVPLSKEVYPVDRLGPDEL